MVSGTLQRCATLLTHCLLALPDASSRSNPGFLLSVLESMFRGGGSTALTTAVDPPHPRACTDKVSKQLLRETQKPLPLGPGRPQRRDYGYERGKVGNPFLFCEPLRVVAALGALDLEHICPEVREQHRRVRPELGRGLVPSDLRGVARLPAGDVALGDDLGRRGPN